jgi:hypothetical protein
MAAMQQVTNWFERLGMSKYAQLFAENKIDFSALRDLTVPDLKYIGAVPRRLTQMARAIGELWTRDARSLEGDFAGHY